MIKLNYFTRLTFLDKVNSKLISINTCLVKYAKTCYVSVPFVRSYNMVCHKQMLSSFNHGNNAKQEAWISSLKPETNIRLTVDLQVYITPLVYNTIPPINKSTIMHFPKFALLKLSSFCIWT